ncbi:unnamed protein product, partial [Polarella glacialis]
LLLASSLLVAQCAAKLRTVDSCLQHVVLLPVDHPIAVALVTAGTEYHNQRSSGLSAAELGEPFWHTWKALILSVQQCADIPSKDLALLQTHATAITEPAMLRGKVFVCFANVTFDKKFVKLLVSVHSSLEPLMEVVIAALRKQGADIKFGPAPKSKQEREVLRLLHNISSQKS